MQTSRLSELETARKLGKSEARQEFGPLVESVAAGEGAVEISDYGKVVAVVISANEYRWLLSQTKKDSRPKKSLRGAFIIHDDLEVLSEKIRADFKESINRTASEL